MKKVSFSRIEIDEDVMVRKNYHRYIEGQVVTVTDNEKKKPLYTIEVKDSRGIVDRIPTKYLKRIK